MSNNCPVCKTVLNVKKPTHNPAFSTYAYDCPRCGKFMFTFSESELAMKLNYGHDDFKIFVLSHNIRKMQKNDSEVVLDGNFVDRILKGELPTPAEQKDIFIRWVGDNIKGGGDYIKVNSFSILAIIGARTLKEFYFILDYLKRERLIESKTVVGGGTIDIVKVTLSFDGHEYYEELKSGDTDKQKSIMAIESVPKEQIDEIHDSSNDGNTSMEWDIFICHASEDKGSFVEPLANALKKAGLKVWYDRFELKLGDSLRGKIDEGLANSRYGVVVLSSSFFQKNWPKTELDALVSRENKDGQKVILPIWHEVDKKQVEKFSPILAGKFAAKSSDSLESIVSRIVNVLNGSSVLKKPANDKIKLEEICDEAKELLLEAVKDRGGNILLCRTMDGTALNTNGRNLIPDQDSRTIAKWEYAVEELEENRFIKATGLTGEVFIVTHKGYSYADKLREAIPPGTSTEILLTDPGDITNKLIWWLGQQSSFVYTQTKLKQPVVWHFKVIDDKLNLALGSSKKYLPKVLNSDESPFPAIVENISIDTIRLKYDFSS